MTKNFKIRNLENECKEFKSSVAERQCSIKIRTKNLEVSSVRLVLTS